MAETSDYRTIYRCVDGKYEEKKSTFLAYARRVTTEEEAVAFIDEIKKKNWDARHNCFAYSIGHGSNPLLRASDDGEPQGTAGRPMLDVLTGAGLTDIVLVVTRYFGGVLLGTGGLVRAYTQASKDCLEKSTCIDRVQGAHLVITTDYGGIGKMQYLLAQADVPVLNSEYTDLVKMEVILPKDQEGKLRKEIAEATAGKADVEDLGDTYFSRVDGQVLLDLD